MVRLRYLRRAGSLLCQEGTNTESQELHLQVLGELRQQNPLSSSVTVPKHQPRLTQDSNSTDLVHLAPSICPRALEGRVQPFLTHSSSSALEFQLEEERLSQGGAWLSLVQMSPAVSSALPFALAPGAAQQPCAVCTWQGPDPCASTTTPTSAGSSSPPRGFWSSSRHICPPAGSSPWQLHENQQGKTSHLSPMSCPVVL